MMSKVNIVYIYLNNAAMGYVFYIAFGTFQDAINHNLLIELYHGWSLGLIYIDSFFPWINQLTYIWICYLSAFLDLWIGFYFSVCLIDCHQVTDGCFIDCFFTLRSYRQVSNIRRAISQHSKDSCTVFRLSLLNPLKPDVKSRMKM